MNSLGFLEGPNVTVTITGANVGRFERIKLNADGTYSQAGAADVAVAVTRQPINANERGIARLLNATGTHPGVSDAAIARGTRIYGGASGRVSATATGQDLVAFALTATTAAGQELTFVRVG